MRLLLLLLYILAFSLVVAHYYQQAELRATAKTGSWSFYIAQAELDKKCKGTVEVAGDKVTVTIYGCKKAKVDVYIESRATVPLCLEPHGPVEGKARVRLSPGEGKWQTYVFTDNGTLTFTKGIGSCR
ncbi:hypothetical protein [Pyrobaculum neutrophilum]|uniref:Uncharacterized protein n=1 Tax=Pyrobaculum neutrophilum (strain DSM 2338 / JCM 9278 / NBRC 100436 / V24Sta) TaxID=444157 RepID=B1YDQ6_PYRNV|nr:hypothetical protein [Pyrobaculum neutrophilum]ACB39919.1 hypothetical protein Tneu_0986 [Pyrobaculum neutrophilum V24Sta]